MLFKQVGNKLPSAAIVRSSNFPASNTAAVITLTALEALKRLVDGIQWSYSDIPTGGKITVTDNAVIIFETDITSGGPGGFAFCLPGAVNSQLVITLAAGGSGITGKLNVQSSIEAD